MKTFCLLHGGYLPYYKWSFRAVRGMDGGAALAESLSRILTGDPAESTRIRSTTVFATAPSATCIF